MFEAIKCLIMELLYIYIWNDKRNIKGCEYNFSPNYKFSYQPGTKTFYMEERSSLPNNWFGDNIHNITAIVGKNGAGKSNLIDCIIKALCGQGDGVIFYKYNNLIYSNIPNQVNDYNFDFKVERFDRFGSPLNSEFKEHVNDTFVVFYSPTIDRSLSNKHSHYSKFRDLSNSYILRQPLSRLTQTPEYAQISDVDIMQTNDIFRLLLFFVYSHEYKHSVFESIKLPEYFELKLLYYSDSEPQHPTYKVLSNDVPTEKFKARLKKFILTQIFLLERNYPESWDNDTTFEEVLLSLNNGENYRPNIFDTLCQLYDSGDIIYKEELTGLRKGYYEFKCKIRIGAISQEFINALYCYYNFIPMAPYASFGTIESNVSNAQVVINYGMSSGERALYTFFSRLIGEIFGKQGEIHHAAINKIIHDNKYDGKTIIILLDEPDLQLHPEWQQKFIDMLLQLLWLYFPKVKFQIIITTHSPILLSDIPKKNVIFIDKNFDGSSRVCNEVDFNETFAANIHSLYNNSFFLDGIPIGCFAKRKVEELYDKINNDVLSDNIIEDIYRIGEPIIRGVLLKLYDEKRKSSKKSERIKMLKKELSKLEEEANND